MQRNTQIQPGRVDWSVRGPYIAQRHGIARQQADEALADPDRVVIDPDYNSASGRSTRVIGFSMSADGLVTVIVLIDDGIVYGVNAWLSNDRDRRLYAEGRS